MYYSTDACYSTAALLPYRSDRSCWQNNLSDECHTTLLVAEHDIQCALCGGAET